MRTVFEYVAIMTVAVVILFAINSCDHCPDARTDNGMCISDSSGKCDRYAVSLLEHRSKAFFRPLLGDCVDDALDGIELVCTDKDSFQMLNDAGMTSGLSTNGHIFVGVIEVEATIMHEIGHQIMWACGIASENDNHHRLMRSMGYGY